MPELIIPESAEPKETKVDVKVITSLDEIVIGPEELEKARKSLQSTSKMIVLESEVRRAIQQQIAGWANWFALFYPQMPKTFDSAMKCIGYEIIKNDPKVITET